MPSRYRIIYVFFVKLFLTLATQCYSDEIESNYICIDLMFINKTVEKLIEHSTYFRKCDRNCFCIYLFIIFV